MAASKFLACALFAVIICRCAGAQDATQPAPTTSTAVIFVVIFVQFGHRTVHHIRVPDEDSPTQPAELVQAEAAIEKQNYAAAESLLHKLLDRDASSYVGWFDLGFMENALGNVDASIAAYRKSVAAKPDVFESNLNLGLQLAKTGQPDAQEFLRAATRLKPTSHMAEGQYRAWLALGHALEKSKPEEALAAYRARGGAPTERSRTAFCRRHLLEQENKFAEAEREYKQALVLDPKATDAVMGLANVYMRGRRFPDAENYLRKLLAENMNSAAVQIQLGRVLAAEGKNDEAIAALQAGIKLAPDDEGAKRDLAEEYTAAEKK